MSKNSPLILTLATLSLTLLITSCASTSNLGSNNPENNEHYWYCAPGDQRAWRCAEDDEAPGLSYYRPQKPTPDLEVEQLKLEESEQSADDPIMVQGAKVSVVEELSAEVADETAANLSYETDEKSLDGELTEELISQQPPAQDVSNSEMFDSAVTETKSAYGKVLQLAAYHSQNQARSFADSLDETLSKTPNLVRTRVNGQIYYTVVFDQLNSQQEAEQLITELAESFPSIQPWLRSRSGFLALRAD
ncbi:SPOR domain-containing protein [Kangiella koreensis]|uniref:Sporulation domain protein n=1 Tax=Kangiella koreensis (strain DSM 16069 / JCM 12317 / KCTC 12182 / SW-125) TaxID=523791 RepID=C7R723_KANKD|nr:SPOR domain-containing protein [Kangiella koreensis]ACV27479.1 Sporulation domain protein [Kangiella koreensis DSM 16069]